jgi:fucose permease
MVSIIQFALVAVLLYSLPLWKRARPSVENNEKTTHEAIPLPQLIGLPGAKQVLVVFFCYCALEATVGLWGSSYLVVIRGIPEVTAARWISLYYIGITFGRFLSGFLAMKLRHKQIVQLGQLIIVAGIAIILLPIQELLLMAGFFLIGLGCAPIFPSLMHETPINFGSKYSQSMIGVQMASAYIGSTFMPPLFGVIGARVSYHLLPYYVGLLLLLMIFMVISLYKKI